MYRYQKRMARKMMMIMANRMICFKMKHAMQHAMMPSTASTT